MARLVHGGMAATTAQALQRLYDTYADLPVRTITTDRGMEFADLPQRVPGRHFVCDAYRAGQLGLCEKTIGLRHQYFPKNTSLDRVTQAHIDRAVALINNRPASA